LLDHHWQDVRTEAARSLVVLDDALLSDSAFEQVFMKQLDFALRFDCQLALRLPRFDQLRLPADSQAALQGITARHVLHSHPPPQCAWLLFQTFVAKSIS
jgi:hypothetical protein